MRKLLPQVSFANSNSWDQWSISWDVLSVTLIILPKNQSASFRTLAQHWPRCAQWVPAPCCWHTPAQSPSTAAAIDHELSAESIYSTWSGSTEHLTFPLAPSAMRPPDWNMSGSPAQGARPSQKHPRPTIPDLLPRPSHCSADVGIALDDGLGSRPSPTWF